MKIDNQKKLVTQYEEGNKIFELQTKQWDGVKETCCMITAYGFDLIHSFAIDYMHQCWVKTENEETTTSGHYAKGPVRRKQTFRLQ